MCDFFLGGRERKWGRLANSWRPAWTGPNIRRRKTAAKRQMRLDLLTILIFTRRPFHPRTVSLLRWKVDS